MNNRYRKRRENFQQNHRRKPPDLKKEMLVKVQEADKTLNRQEQKRNSCDTQK